MKMVIVLAVITIIAIALCRIAVWIGRPLTIEEEYARRLAKFDKRFAHLSHKERSDLHSLLIARRRINRKTSESAMTNYTGYRRVFDEAVKKEIDTFRIIKRPDLAKRLAAEVAENGVILDPEARKVIDARDRAQMAKMPKKIKVDRDSFESLNFL